MQNNKFVGKFITIIGKNSIYYFVLYLLCSKLNKTLVTLNHDANFEVIKDQIKNFKLNNIFCSIQLKIYLKKSLNSNFLNINKKNKIIFNNKKEKNEIFLLTFSSGSSNKPKPIAISEKTKIDRAIANIESFKVKKRDKIIISTPLHHTLAIRLMTMGILLGSEIIFMEKYNLTNFLKLVKLYNCKFTFFVSNQLIEISKYKRNLTFLKSLNCLVSSSSPLPLDEKNKLLKYFPKKIYEMYGLSEAAVVSVLKIDKKKQHINSVGRPIKNVKVKIDYFKKEEVGEISIKSKYLFLGYFTNNKLKKNNNKNYFKTGDVGFIKDGYIYFTGRKKNIIKINGISIYLDDIANFLIKKKIVEDCVVTSIENKMSVNPRICLLFKSNKFNASFIKNFCFKNLPIYQIPTYILKINRIPKNKMKKLNMVEIKKFIYKKLNIN